MVWLVVYLVAVSMLAGVAWVVLLVVYPAFALVGPAQWPTYHAAHLRGITRVVLVPWVAQGVATAVLLVFPPQAGRWAAVALAAFALAGVMVTVAGAVPAHNRLGAVPSGAALVTLMRVHLARTVVWSTSALLSAVLLF